MVTPEKIVEENWDLVMTVTIQTVKRYRFPRHLWVDIESAAALALWSAAEKYKPQMRWDIIDAV